MGAAKLLTAAGGSITLDAASTATDKTITVPADNGTLVYANSSGNVGIGTSSPATKLDVSGPASVTSFTGTTKLGVVTRGSISTNDYSGIDFIGGNLTTPVARIAALTTGGGSTLSFGTSNSYGSGITNTAMTIDTSGNLLVGTTSSVNGRLQVKNSDGTWPTGISLIEQGTNNYWGSSIYPVTHDYYIGYNGANKGYFQSSGGSYVAVSDARLKKDIQDLPYGLDEVLSLRPTSYRMTEQDDAAPKSLGFIAQETMEVLPETVFEMQGGMYGMDKSAIIPVLVKAIQEQQALINAQQAALTTLTERITALEQQ